MLLGPIGVGIVLPSLVICHEARFVLLSFASYDRSYNSTPSPLLGQLGGLSNRRICLERDVALLVVHSESSRSLGSSSSDQSLLRFRAAGVGVLLGENLYAGCAS